MIALRPLRLLKMALCSVLALAAAQACGPDFFPDVFVRTNRPDFPEQFVKGRLGLLQPGFARADLFVAYRYLNGGTLDSKEQAGWQPTYSFAEQEYGPERSVPPPTADATDTPVTRWVQARSAFPGAPAGPIGQEATIQLRTAQGFQYEDHFLNCADDAFLNATNTLRARATLWGRTSPYLLDWIHAQDTVFNNCSGGSAVPAPAPSGSPVLLAQDRAYQVAAAHFYSQAFPVAAQEFLAIGKAKASPWQVLGGYLAGRVLVRQAFFARPSAEAQASYDPVILQAAEDQYRAYLAGKPPADWQAAAEKQLALIRIRLEPAQRTRELAALVSGPGHDANYPQDLQDLLWITSAKTPDGLRAQPELYQQVPDPSAPGNVRFVTEQEAEKAAGQKRQTVFAETASERALAPILDWALTVQSLAASAPEHALSEWRRTHELPWLVAALVLAPNGTAPSPDLLDAAAKVMPGSPAWETVAYHRARLLIAAGRTAEAGTVVAAFSSQLQQIPVSSREPSTVNAVRGLQMTLAGSAADFLNFAQRFVLLYSSEEYSSVQECLEVMKDPARHYRCVSQVGPEQLDEDAARVFNEQAPLSFWLAAAKSEKLSPQLRAAVVEQGWTRSVLLDDAAAATSFQALLPETLREQVKAGGPALAPWIVLARNPGLRPYLNAGTQRAYSYDFVESYRDNWCYKLEQATGASVPAAFLSAAEQKAGELEARRLADVRSLYVGQQIVRGVQTNLHDPQAAEALFLVLRMVRYGCTPPAAPKQSAGDNPVLAVPANQEAEGLLKLKLEAARLLRQYYAASPWTKKAAPFAG